MFRSVFIVFIICIFSNKMSNAQSTTTTPEIDPDEGKIFSFCEVMPEFPGGSLGMVKFIHSNLKCPEKYAKVEGTVYVSFVVMKTGKLQDIKIIKGIKGADE